jgi:branched-chain amino acid aminotransferase
MDTYNLMANDSDTTYKRSAMNDIKKCEKRPKASYPLHPKFGSIFGPHVLKMNLTVSQTEPKQAEIIPYANETFVPGASVLHYGQSIFEGLKVYRQKDGGVAAFRADLHAARFMKSARRLAMPEIGEDVFLKCLKEYMHFEAESVPSEAEHSLYIRPLLIARDEIIKIGRSQSYTFFIMSAIAGSYFHGRASNAARVLVNREFVRAFPGGLGEVKTAGNYAASLMAQTYAEQFKCDQVLYLDAAKHEHIDELGGMNFFMIRKGELVTPALEGTILNGVTRRSILELAPTLGLKAREARISFSEMMSEIRSGIVTETFACGTAATIHSIGEFVVQEKKDSPTETIALPKETPISTKMLDTLQAAQRGHYPVPANWLFR